MCRARSSSRGSSVGTVPVTILVVLALVLVLVLPFPPQAVRTVGEATPFRWDAAEMFESLEAEFESARAMPRDRAQAAAELMEGQGRALLEQIAVAEVLPVDALEELAELQFRYGVLGAAHPELLPEVEALISGARVEVMTAAAGWVGDRETHESLYRVVFGGRLTMEEAIVQAGPVGSDLVQIEDIASATPFLDVQGVRVHSGDILLSRGGAPTSALIARGSDFANTFSHAALVHVDEATGVGTVVESLIETGTVLTTVDEYLEGKKHRILVLRLRPDLAELQSDPLLPHRAATQMLQRLRVDPAPYDFAMDWTDPERMFCSEVIYHAFSGLGLDLWSHRSAMTTPGLVRWLSAMGVREFRTLVPSDLEYDARFRAVVEWRDVGALMDYRLDNAITDVLLERADAGSDLGYPWLMRPAGRLLKALSVGQSAVGSRPRIPAGMTVDAALRVRALVEVVHPLLKTKLVDRARSFEMERGYPAPYWTLVELARQTLEQSVGALEPSLQSGEALPLPR